MVSSQAVVAAALADGETQAGLLLRNHFKPRICGGSTSIHSKEEKVDVP
jgi:hypothetical protein